MKTSGIAKQTSKAGVVRCVDKTQDEEPETCTLITTLQRGGLMSVAEGIVPP